MTQGVDREQTHEYIRHRLSLAGREQANLFTPEACDSIFAVSAGIPRIINLLSDMSLGYGYADHKPTIDAATVDEMLGDKARDGGWLFEVGK